MAVQRTFIVTIAHSYSSNMSAAVTSLQSHGLQVKQVLNTLGQVIGEASAERVDELKDLDCVESVDAEGQYKAL